MKSPIGILAVFACAFLPLVGCKSREESKAQPKQLTSSSRDEAGATVSERAGVLATIPVGTRPNGALLPSARGPHDLAPAPIEGEVEYLFAERGGGVAWIATEGGKSRVMHNGTPGKVVDEAKAVALSLDGRRIAYAAAEGGRWRIVVDESVGDAFDEVDSPGFSPDGRHVAYKARRGDQWYLVVDAARSGPSKGGISNFGFSSDSSSIAFIEVTDGDGWGRLIVSDLGLGIQKLVAKRAWGLIFNSAKTRIAAVSEVDGRQHVVSAGFDRPEHAKVGPAMEEVSAVAFGSDGITTCYVAKSAGNPLVVCDDREAPLRLDDSPVGSPVISRDRSVAGIPVVSNGMVVIRPLFSQKGATQRVYSGIEDLSYTGDGQGHAYVAERKDGLFVVVVDGREGPPFDRAVSAVLSPDERFVVYRARKDGKRFVVVADRSGKTVRQHPAYEQVFPVQFTADGKSVAYGVKNGRTLEWRVESL